MGNDTYGYKAGWRKELNSQNKNKCGSCGIIKPLSEFYKKGETYRDGADRYTTECKACCNIRSNASRKKRTQGQKEETPIVKTVNMLSETKTMTIDQAIEEYEVRIATLKAAKAMLCQPV
jgi:hypothetical protein